MALCADPINLILRIFLLKTLPTVKPILLVKLLSMEVRYFIKYNGIKIILIVKSLINITITYKVIMVHVL